MKDLLKEAYDPERFRELGHQLIDQLADHLSAAQAGDDPRAIAWKPADAAYEYWKKDARQMPDPAPLSLFEEVLKQSVHLHNPRYMGHQISPPAPVTVLAGLLGDFMNNGMGVYEMGAAATAIERVVMKMLARRLGFGEAADGVLTSGGSLANLTALLAARSIKAEEVWREGHREPLALLVSEEAHYCVDRAARIMGWGEEGIVKVPVDTQFRMRTELLPEYLERAGAAGRRVIAVVGSACSTSTGSFDDLEAIADFCEREDLWFHIDGAHGAPAAFSQKYASVVQGIARADTVAMDFHKMLMTPSVTTALVFRNGAHSYDTFHQQGQYLWNRDEEAEWHNLAKRTFECTKLMLSVKAYSLLRTHGWELIDQYVTTVIDNGRHMADLIRKRSNLELAITPPCNIVCFRYHSEGITPAQLDEINEGLRQHLLEDGRFYIVKTKLNGHTWLRCTLTNPFTTDIHLKELLSEVEKKGEFLLERKKEEV